MRDDARDAMCVACGRVRPPGGLRLTDDYAWTCARAVACASEIARQIREGTDARMGSLDANMRAAHAAGDRWWPTAERKR